ncbi:Oidioi.mRNA.OKI2018_I69.chr2.g8162.t1.cds [Oikopleura dioica]|uniref:Oidioi.mRNA.OKI2018_I69.chr2.g8162.t1.cds n=1 Tax=Oikopleura dioica TaxID=34765 RepID=A0ABN7TCX0_OIKDI|nr:Oidioi.mRNA.OKI2018_I69.chr2.g8162.t1.cds [Oikopleura dioica]
MKAHVVEQKGETLLPNWLGLYRCGISNRSDRYLLVTKSITRRIEVLSEAFRLKGTKMEKIEKKQKKEKKKEEKEEDKEKKELREPEWLQSGNRLHLIPSDAERFRTYLKNDLELLQRLKLMNYSLDVRLCPQSDDEKEENHDSGHDGGANSGDNRDSESDEEDEFESSEAPTFRFKLENGGIVYLSLNEILNHYDTKKKAQNAVKSATHGNDEDKKVNPERYSRQFTEFLSSAVFTQWN